MEKDEIIGTAAALTSITVLGFGWTLVGAAALALAHKLLSNQDSD